MSKHVLKAVAAATFSVFAAGAAWSDVGVIPHRIDFNNDLKGDLTFINSNGTAALWLMNGNMPSSGDIIHGAIPLGAVPVLAGDMDGNGTADIIFRAPPQTPGNGYSYWLSTMDGFTATTTHFLWEGSNWNLISRCDLNGDGKMDLLWYNPSTGETGAWLMNAAASPQIASVGAVTSPGAGYQVRFAADFNGDGKTDLVWTHPDGSVAIELMDSYTATATQVYQVAGWTPVGVGDFNGDGKADLVWQGADGSIAIWLMNGANPTGGATVLGPNTRGLAFDRVTDFNGDGRNDLVWKKPDGSYEIWQMAGAAISGQMSFNAGPGWSIFTQGDFNGDGKTDLLLRNSDGGYATWLMDGLGFVPNGAQYVLGPGNGWESVQLP